MTFFCYHDNNRTLFISRNQLEKCKQLLQDKSQHDKIDPEQLWKAKKGLLVVVFSREKKIYFRFKLMV